MTSSNVAMTAPAGRAGRQGGRSRDAILDAAERLMSAHGYDATSISRLCAETGLPPTSIYWHFGSKDGVLAAVMQRGAHRWFAAMPSWDDLESPAPDRLDELLQAWARSLGEHPDFLRLFYTLALQNDREDPAVDELVRSVRETAIARFADVVPRLLPVGVDPALAERIVTEVTTFSVALSDGFFFAAHLEPQSTDLLALCRLLVPAARALVQAGLTP